MSELGTWMWDSGVGGCKIRGWMYGLDYKVDRQARNSLEAVSFMLFKKVTNAGRTRCQNPELEARRYVKMSLFQILPCHEM